MQEVYIYTDGACSPNPGLGGWGVLLLLSKSYKTFSGVQEDTTNNEMELTAIINALKLVNNSKNHKAFRIVSDSSYCLNGVQQWMAGWKRNNWKTKQKDDVKNRHLWEQIDLLVSQASKDGKVIKWEKVKGHSGDPNNELVDGLATSEIKKFRELEKM